MQGELRRRGRSPSPARPGVKPGSPAASPKATKTAPAAVVAELEAEQLSPMDAFFKRVAGPLLLLIPCPILCMVLSFVTCAPAVKSPTLSGAAAYISQHGASKFVLDAFAYCGFGSARAWTFLFVFNFMALLVYHWPGPVKYGPITPTGHKPEYMDNGIAHCVLYTAMFVGGSQLGLGW
jgi:hypothetical protein